MPRYNAVCDTCSKCIEVLSVKHAETGEQVAVCECGGRLIKVFSSTIRDIRVKGGTPKHYK